MNTWLRPWRWASTLCLALGLVVATPLAAQPTAAGDSPPFVLAVQAPAPFDALLQQHLELVRFQRLPDLGRTELERLLAQTPANVRELLGTQGHFSPTVDLQLNEATQAGAPPVVNLRVDPGPLTRIASVNLWLFGPAQSDAAAAEHRAQLPRDWSLSVGQPFSQSAWDSAKAGALRGFTARRYPQAQWRTTLADIDAEAQAAHLYLELDSGAAYHYGAVSVQGQRRYDPAMAERLVRLAGVRPGAPYDEAVLQSAQQRLLDSGYYASAFVLLGEGDDPAQTPVQVRVREWPLQQLTAGVGLSTDRGPRLSLEHTHHQLPGLGWRAISKLQWEREARILGADLTTPVNDQGWRWIGGAQFQRQADAPLVTISQQFRIGRSQDDPLLDRHFFVQLDRARVDDLVSDSRGETASAMSANASWTRRRFDNLTAPTRGHGLSVELGLGLTLDQERQLYLRSQARWQAYWPLTANSSHPGRLAARLEGGAIWSGSSTPVPATQRFLAGGDQSVRGYGLREIGVPVASGGVEAGRLLTVASLEWQRPVWVNGQRSAWETAVFADAGAVANTVSALDAQVGLGAGVRYRSPVGPLQADLAYGLDSRRWRLHLRVGFTF